MFLKKFRLPFHSVPLTGNQIDCQRILRQQILNMSSGSKYKVLVTRSDYPDSGISILKEKNCELDIWDISNGLIPRDELLNRIKGKDALFFNLGDKVDAEVIKAAGDQLKVLATMSVGLDHVNLADVKKAGVRLGYTPNVLTEATAELTVALLLATCRRLFQANAQLRSGGWKSWSAGWMCGPSLEDAYVGIFGYGRIGKSVARKLKAFSISGVLYTGRKQTKDEEDGAVFCELDDFLGRSDFIVVNCPLNEKTINFFDKEKFSKMKPTAVFVNSSRGGVVDQEALIEALKDKKIACAGLDVMVPEPIPIDHPLLSMDNVVLLPHLGTATIRARSDMSKQTGENIIAALEGQPMPAEFKP